MIVVTGATGKTGSKIAQFLLEKGVKIRALGRSYERLKPFTEKGAEVMAGDQSDEKFLIKAFKGALAAYVLIPPKLDTEDFRKYYNTLGDTAIKAIRRTRLKKFVFLSSLGAGEDYGTGTIQGLRDVEKKLSRLRNVDTVFLRAGIFMENILMNLTVIK